MQFPAPDRSIAPRVHRRDNSCPSICSGKSPSRSARRNHARSPWAQTAASRSRRSALPPPPHRNAASPAGYPRPHPGPCPAPRSPACPAAGSADSASRAPPRPPTKTCCLVRSRSRCPPRHRRHVASSPQKIHVHRRNDAASQSTLPAGPLLPFPNSYAHLIKGVRAMIGQTY